MEKGYLEKRVDPGQQGLPPPSTALSQQNRTSTRFKSIAKGLAMAFSLSLIALLLTSVAPFSSFANPVQQRAPASSAHEFAGEPTSDVFPPTKTAKDPGDDDFPNESQVGVPGPTPTGTESFVIQGAPTFPKVQNYFPLVRAPTLDSDVQSDFDIVKSWGNLSPFQSVPQDAFGLDSSSQVVPEGCNVERVILTHRHGARYPTSDAGPAKFAAVLANATKKGTFKAKGPASFLNDWKYPLGSEILTPYGRKELYELGVGFRQKYGHLLNNFTEQEKLPVFRTTSEDRMVKSALNFAAGFFGIPYEPQYHQEIIIEDDGYNNTLAPYDICPNDGKYSLATAPLGNWTSIYLKDALKRIQPMLKGVELTTTDIYNMQQLCPYETVALGYSRFCELFTQEEWEGFDYSIDLSFWYGSFFGAPTTAAQGVGWVQELVARLTQTPIAVHNSTTNSTLNDSKKTFPLDQSIDVDATHDTVITTFLVAMNATNFVESGPLPWDHIPSKRSYITRYVSPFAANLHGTVLDCPTSIYAGNKKKSKDGEREKFIRWILNDAVLPGTGLKGCEYDPNGLCPLDTHVAALKERIQEIDFDYECNADYSVNYNIVDGRPPKHSS